jgi:hypothetical protein
MPSCECRKARTSSHPALASFVRSHFIPQ